MRINVLGVGFDNLTLREAIDRGAALLDEAGCHYVVTPNPEIVEVCRENPEAMRAVNGAALVLPDGIGVIKGAAMLGTPLKEKTPGIEFAMGLMGKMAERGKSLYLLGAKPGVAEQAAARLKARYPGLKIAGTHDGYFKEDAPVVEAIRESGADCVFVCLGAPKQELWMEKNGPATGARLRQPLAQQPGLRGLAGTVRPLEYDELPFHFLLLFSCRTWTRNSGRRSIRPRRLGSLHSR